MPLASSSEMPQPLNWGTRKRMRCVNVAVSTIRSENSAECTNLESKLQNLTLLKDSESMTEKREFTDAMEALREKIICNLESVSGKEKEEESPVKKNDDVSLPWKLRQKNIGKNERKTETEKKETEKKETKLVVPLSKKEIDEDFMEMLGRKPKSRPKKRPRVVQNSLDTLFPGLGLSKISADLYDVPETT